MAIHPAYPRLEAEVVVDGEALREYAEDELIPDNNEVKNYIQVRSEAFFGVRYYIPKALFANYAVKAVIEINGVRMRSSPYNKRRCAFERTIYMSLARINGVPVGQKFRFAKLNPINTEQGTQASKQQISEIGNISVLFYAIKDMEISKNRRDKAAPALLPHDATSEEDLKGQALTHTAELSPLQRRSEPTVWRYEYVDPHKLPFAVFHFKYRSLEALKSIDVIPRTPSPMPLEDRPAEDLNPAELVELVNRYRNHEAETRRIKQEKTHEVKRERATLTGNPANDDDLSLVEERPVKRRRGPRADDEVIELD